MCLYLKLKLKLISREAVECNSPDVMPFKRQKCNPLQFKVYHKKEVFKFTYTSNDTDTFTCVCHADKTRCCVFCFKVLVRKVFAIDAYRSSTIMLDNISTWNTKAIKSIIIKASTSFLGNSYMQQNVPNHNLIFHLFNLQ